ncbi:MAG TPA: acetyl ornithine aminotransferase family protein [Candidatus Acidoferrales bacterium]|nr:acetyl ornithine aminotransferase family protein [Candidatus Acidoferrales bacterium]
MKKANDWKLPRLVTSLPGPKAKKLVGLDTKFISPSYTRGYPLVAKTGRGAVIEDLDGNQFLDFAAGIAVVATGHCHPEVVAAIQKQAGELIHMSGTDFYYENMVELAEKLATIAPGKDPKRVYFGNSGTEAIEAAIKLARYHTKRDKFIAFYGCFHGRTMGSLSLTASKAVQRKNFGPLLGGVAHIPYPDTYRSLGQNADECSRQCLEFLENEVFHRLMDPADVAAIFVEPIQGEGGYVAAPASFLQGLQKICRREGILLVADEVQCGMGRTGKWWASEHAHIDPDIVCVAKGIASGMPLGATIARASVMDWKPGAHASTFGGNPVCVAASLATIDLIEKKYMENARQMGKVILDRMADWIEKYRIVGDVRGKGLMIGVEIVRDKKTKERAGDLRNKIVDRAFEKGLLILGAGENTVRVAPPLVIDEEQAEYAVRILGECIAEVQRSH